MSDSFARCIHATYSLHLIHVRTKIKVTVKNRCVMRVAYIFIVLNKENYMKRRATKFKQHLAFLMTKHSSI
jgi:hypothetical protein